MELAAELVSMLIGTGQRMQGPVSVSRLPVSVSRRRSAYYRPIGTQLLPSVNFFFLATVKCTYVYYMTSNIRLRQLGFCAFLRRISLAVVF